MRAVPREQFVPAEPGRFAYEDGALPIGHGQTISQPYIVASMTQALALPAGATRTMASVARARRWHRFGLPGGRARSARRGRRVDRARPGSRGGRARA